jgi:flagellar basal body-associated protein FliL
MSVGAIFILLVVVIVLLALGFAFYLLVMRLRGRQLHPEGDRLEGGAEGEAGGQERPEHVRPGRPQRARFLPDR